MEEQTTVVDQPQSEEQQPIEQAVTQPTQEVSFLETLPEDLRQEPSLQNFRNVEDMAKSLVHAQKMVGADKISIPGKHATEDDWKQVYSKLGVPESPEGYEVKYEVQEGASDQPVKEFVSQAHKLGLLPHQAQGILDYYSSLESQGRDELQKQAELSKVNSEQELRKEFGLAYDSKVQKANQVFKNFFADDMAEMKLQDGTSLGNHPAFIKALSGLSDKFSEDNLGTGQEENSGITPVQAEKEISKILGDKDHPYWNKNHPNHQAAVEEVFQLQNMKLGIETE